MPKLHKMLSQIFPKDRAAANSKKAVTQNEIGSTLRSSAGNVINPTTTATDGRMLWEPNKQKEKQINTSYAKRERCGVFTDQYPDFFLFFRQQFLFIHSKNINGIIIEILEERNKYVIL